MSSIPPTNSSSLDAIPKPHFQNKGPRAFSSKRVKKIAQMALNNKQQLSPKKSSERPTGDLKHRKRLEHALKKLTNAKPAN